MRKRAKLIDCCANWIKASDYGHRWCPSAAAIIVKCCRSTGVCGWLQAKVPNKPTAKFIIFSKFPPGPPPNPGSDGLHFVRIASMQWKPKLILLFIANKNTITSSTIPSKPFDPASITYNLITFSKSRISGKMLFIILCVWQCVVLLVTIMWLMILHW